MKLYFAAAESALKELADAKVRNLLITMAHGEKKIPKVPQMFGDEFDLIIDSGAFTYFSKKKTMTPAMWIPKAAALIKAVPKAELISLDVIGNAEKSWENYVEIRKSLPDAMPTFHVGSDIKYLDMYLEHTTRIAIGGMVPLKSEIAKLRRFVDAIFSRFSLDAMPRLHAFGYFSQDVLENYPWYSADASTWQNYSRFGEFHRFEKLQYTRRKSLSVQDFNPRGMSMDDLYIYSQNTAELKLAAIRKAIGDYEQFLTELWKKRQVTFR